MEIAIPIVALGSLYLASKQSKKGDSENFDNMNTSKQILPNTNLPNKNYPDEYPVVNFETDQTSYLSANNKYDIPVAFTDKYFQPEQNKMVTPNKPVSGAINATGGLPAAGSTQDSSTYYSLTGDKVDASYFQHNNMVPYFGGNVRSQVYNVNSNESVLDNMQGGGSQSFRKTEQSPLFMPQDSAQFPYGMPSTSDFIQSRMNVGMKMSNVKPFVEERVAPGLGEGSAGFNSGMMARDQWMPKTADELRTANKPKSSGLTMLGHEGPAYSNVQNIGILGKMEKNRPETAFEHTPERYLTTTGAFKAQTLHSIPIDRHVQRETATMSYTGIAGAHNPSSYVDGEYMPSKHMDLGELPLGVASATGRSGAYDVDYGIQGKQAYPNNRSVARNDDYFGAIGGAFGAVVSPLMDMLRPSRRENTIGSLRPYQNPKSEVANSYLFDPSNRMPTTIRETTEQSKGHLFVNSGQKGDAYMVTGHQVADTNRHTVGAYNYSGIASAGEGHRQVRPYDAEYNQRNNDIKSSTIQGRMVPGNMSLLNSDINMREKTMDQFLQNQRSTAPMMPYKSPDLSSMGKLQGTSNQLYSGIQMDRNTPDIMNALKSNPYTLSVTDAFAR